MENSNGDNNILEDMAQQERTSESSRLVSQNIAAKPSYLNLLNNLCSIIFLGIIIYCSFVDGVSLFSFHPTLMSLGPEDAQLHYYMANYLFFFLIVQRRGKAYMLNNFGIALLAFVIWLIVMATAINAVTPGDLATEWMPIRLRSARHWVLQLFGAVIITTGFLIILSNKIINDKPHFATLHAKFGLASLVFMLLTMLGGLGALYSLKLKQYLPPIYTKLLHAMVGLVTFSLGIVTISTGLFSQWFDKNGEIMQYTSLALVLTVMLCTVLRPSLKVYFRLKERLDNTN